MKEIVEAVEMSYTEHARGRVQMQPKNYLFLVGDSGYALFYGEAG